MTKYCGVISVGAVTGGGHVVATQRNTLTGQVNAASAVPIAVELVSFKIGETFFRKLRLCQQFVSQFIHPATTPASTSTSSWASPTSSSA